MTWTRTGSGRLQGTSVETLAAPGSEALTVVGSRLVSDNFSVERAKSVPLTPLLAAVSGDLEKKEAIVAAIRY